MTGCQTCGGFGMHHDPIAHGASREPFWPWDEGYDDEPDELDEPERCELDHRDGGVCLRRLNRDGSCPSEWDHVDGAV